MSLGCPKCGAVQGVVIGPAGELLSCNNCAQLEAEARRAQLTDEPNPATVKEARRTLRNITEGVIGSLLATQAPTVWHSIRSWFKDVDAKSGPPRITARLTLARAREILSAMHFARDPGGDVDYYPIEERNLHLEGWTQLDVHQIILLPMPIRPEFVDFETAFFMEQLGVKPEEAPRVIDGRISVRAIYIFMAVDLLAKFALADFYRDSDQCSRYLTLLERRISIPVTPPWNGDEYSALEIRFGAVYKEIVSADEDTRLLAKAIHARMEVLTPSSN